MDRKALGGAVAVGSHPFTMERTLRQAITQTLENYARSTPTELRFMHLSQHLSSCIIIQNTL